MIRLSHVPDERDPAVPMSDAAGNSVHRDLLSLQHLAAIVESSDDAIFSKTLDGTVLSWNRAAENLYGYTREEMVGGSILRLIPPERADEIQLLMRRLSEGKRVRHLETVRVRKDGTLVDVRLSLSPIRDENGQVVAVSVIAHDITDEKRRLAAVKHAEEMRAAAEAALVSSTARSDFLANMSHEIRSPMNAIIGLAHILSETPLNDEQREFVRLFREAGAALLHIINDFLDLAKMEAGEVRLAADAFDLVDTMETVLETLALRAYEKGLELDLVVAPDVPRTVVGDSGRLRQVLMNLLDNAIKFTAVGKVTLRMARDPECVEAGKLLFSVFDTGEGIPADKLEGIFAPFAQSEPSTSRGGTGLGLSISRRIVEMMGGRLWVESQAGAGSTFSFTVPFGVLQEHEAPPMDGAERKFEQPAERAQAVDDTDMGPEQDFEGPGRVLVVEDEDIHRLVLRRYLRGCGHRVDFASNGREAVDRVQAAEYDVILMDIRMPIMDGYEATRCIRSLEQRCHRSPAVILAVTAGALGDEVRRAMEAGCTAHISKPVSKTELLDLLWRYAGITAR